MSRTRPLARPAKRQPSTTNFKLDRRFWIGALWILGACGAAYGLTQMEPQARALATASPRIEWVSLPHWLENGDAPWPDVLNQLVASLDADGAPVSSWDLFDPRVCPYVANQLQQSPWIEKVERVTKAHDGAIRVWAKFREPFAIVEQGRSSFLVDEHGVRLPNSHELSRLDWLVVQGVSANAPQLGESWTSDDLTAGLKLARFLYAAEASNQLAFRNSIRAIDVTNFRRRANAWAGELQLVTINPTTYIHWGLPPGEEFGIEATAETKLGVLNRLYQERNRLPNSPWIDVRSGEWVDYPKTAEEQAEVG